MHKTPDRISRGQEPTGTPNSLRICFAMPTYFPSFSGGSLRFMGYQPGLRERGIESMVLAGSTREKHLSEADPFAEWPECPEGAMLSPVDIRGTRVHRVRLAEQTSIRRTSQYFKALIWLCGNANSRPDIIQLHSFERVEALYWIWRLKRLKIPVVYAIMIARPAKGKNQFLRALKRIFLRQFYNAFDGVVTSSEVIRDYLREYGVITPISVIPNGVDQARFRPSCMEERSRAKKELGVSGEGPVIMTVGAVSARKGSDLLIRAWVRLLAEEPDAELVLIGPWDGQREGKRTEFEARVNRLIAESPRPNRVHFAGVRSDVNELLGAADVLVLPTLREGGTPNVVLEAMASGIPVVLTPFDGQSELMGRSGMEFEEATRTPDSLADAICRVLHDQPLRLKRIELGLAWVARHMNFDRTLNQFANFYGSAGRRSLSSSSQTGSGYNLQPVDSPPGDN
jgi:glycosyltransferase involved in cell wall biosynthesis